MTSQRPNKLNQFWQELRRRRVVRITTVYAAAAFVILELVSIITEPLKLPEWTLAFMIILLCVGFILAIILSWIYDITPEGIEKTRSLQETREELPEKHSRILAWKIATFISVVVIIGLVIYNILGNTGRSGDIHGLEKSIAVLPFEILNSDEEYAWFGDAMTDEIILQLQNIKEFRVISRTSTLRYKNADKTIPQIGEELGVNYLVEGTVQRQEDEIRIRVQVIRAKNEAHIWGNMYDNQWEDIFDIQSDVAKQIAHELKAILSPEEIKKIEKNPTSNLEAYHLYLKGRWFWNKWTEENIKKGMEYFNKAIELDPSFVPPYINLGSILESQGLFDRRVSPAIDVVEYSDRFTVECDLPGIDQKDIDVSIASGVLTIKGEKKTEKKSEKSKVYKKETWEGSFQRTVSLPTGVDGDKVEATFADGVLKINLPKREEAKTKKIELKAK